MAALKPYIDKNGVKWNPYSEPLMSARILSGSNEKAFELINLIRLVSEIGLQEEKEIKLINNEA